MVELDRKTLGYAYYIFIAAVFIFGLLMAMGGNELASLGNIHGTWKEFFAHMLKHAGEIIGVVAVFSLVSERLAEITILSIFSEDMSKKIRSIIYEELPGIEGSGLTKIVDEIDFRKLLFDLQDGDAFYWLDTYAPSYKTWMHLVDRAARNGATLHFLVLHPQSELAIMRAKELGQLFSPEDFIAELNVFYRNLIEVKRSLELEGIFNMHVRIYSDLLGCPIYIALRDGKPQWAYSSFYLGKATGVQFPHFLWHPRSSKDRDRDYGFIYELYNYIMAKWERAYDFEADERNRPVA